MLVHNLLVVPYGSSIHCATAAEQRIHSTVGMNIDNAAGSLPVLSRLSFSLYDLRDSLWYRPALMTLGAVILAFLMLRVDEFLLADTNLHTWWVFEGGVEGARGVLSAIAGTMMTVVTTAFSITMVTLQLSSSQYSPRILRGFTGDRGNQLVLGIFIATFVYCLLVLRSVRSEVEDVETFVPAMSITVALLLAFVCIGSLIYFFHHATRTIQASVIINNTANDTFGLIDGFLDVQSNEKRSERSESLLDRLPVVATVLAEHPGYLRGVNDSRLIEVAQKHDLLLTMHPRVGDHIFTGSSLMTVQQFTTPDLDDDEDEERDDALLTRLQEAVVNATSPDTADRTTRDGQDAQKDPYEEIADALRGAFTVGIERTLNEDVLFGFQQLADIGLRALSPGVNDPTTAMLCIDQLGEGLIRVQDADDRPTVAVDEDGTSRVIYQHTPFEMFLTISFKHIRHYGSGDPFVCRHLIEVLEAVRNSSTNESARAAVAAEARTIVEAVTASDPLPADLQRVRTAATWAFTGE